MKRIHGGDLGNMERSESTQSGSSSESEEVVGPCLVLKKSKDDLRKPPASAILLNKPCVTLGRTFNVDYCIVSEAISRIHCEFRTCAAAEPTDEWELVDKSGNGVFVNGTKIQRDVGCRLREGDVVDLASTDEPIASYVFVRKHKRSNDPKCKRLKPELQLYEPMQSTSLARETSVVPTQNLPESGTPERLELRRKNDDLAVELQKMKDVMKQQEIALRQRWEMEQEEKKKAEEVHADACKKVEAEEEEKWQQKLAELNARHTTALEEKNQLADRLKSMCDDKSKEAEIEKEKVRLEEELKKKDSECSTMRQKLNELISRNEESTALAIKMRDDLIKNVNETMETELQCSICSELFVKAATLNCAHSYCSYCINEWKQKKPECPICRQKIVSITPSLVLDNFIEKIVETLDSSLKERRKELLEERSKLPAQNVARNSVIVIPDPSAQLHVAVNRGARSRRRPRGGAPGRVTAQVRIQPIHVQIQAIRGGVVQQRGTLLPPGGAARPPPPPPPRGGMNLIPITLVNRPPYRPLLDVPPAHSNNTPIAPSHNVPITPSNNVPIRPRNPLPHSVHPIEISSESQSDDEDEEVTTPYGYYGGHGFCYRCGRGGHWANGCPF